MAISDELKASVKRHEGTGPKMGNRFMPYECPAGKLTLGFGRNIQDRGISLYEAELMLENDLNDSYFEARSIVGGTVFDALSQARQDVLTEMVFNMGGGAFSQFNMMLKAIRSGDYKEAAFQMRASRWAVQVRDRAEEMADVMEKGTWV